MVYRGSTARLTVIETEYLLANLPFYSGGDSHVFSKTVNMGIPADTTDADCVSLWQWVVFG